MNRSNNPTDAAAVRQVAIVLYLWKRWAEHYGFTNSGQVTVSVGLADGTTQDIDLLQATETALDDFRRLRGDPTVDLRN